MKASEVEPGMRFGKLTVLGIERKIDSYYSNERRKIKSSNRPYADCQCDCGKTTFVLCRSLVRNKRPTISCGCDRARTLRRKAAIRHEKYIGETVNHLLVKDVLTPEQSKNGFWCYVCVCLFCGAETIVRDAKFNRGDTKGCAKCAYDRQSNAKMENGKTISKMMHNGKKVDVVKMKLSDGDAIGIKPLVGTSRKTGWYLRTRVENVGCWTMSKTFEVVECNYCRKPFPKKTSTIGKHVFCNVSCRNSYIREYGSLSNGKLNLDCEEIAMLRLNGATWRIIAQKMNCSTTPVRDGFKKWQEQKQS